VIFSRPYIIPPMRIYTGIIALLFSLAANAQFPLPQPGNTGSPSDSLPASYDGNTVYPISRYLVITGEDSTAIDTSLTYGKYRRFNLLHRDDFELFPLHNTGQAYQSLALHIPGKTLFPAMGFRAKHQNYLAANQTPYYRVPTPTSQLFFRTGIQQGQFLHSFITANLSPSFNLSTGYKGLRSLGLYRHALSSHENFRLAANYSGTKGYGLRLHYVAHNFYNEENGGLTGESLAYYLTGNPDYSDRGRLETQYTDAASLLKAKRYYLQNTYDFFSDTLRTYKRLQVGYLFMHEREYYTFEQDKAQDAIGTAYTQGISDSTAFRHTDNALFVKIKSPGVLGDWKWEIRNIDYRYGNAHSVVAGGQTIPAMLKGSLWQAAAGWKARYKGLEWKAAAGSMLNSGKDEYYYSAGLGYIRTKFSVSGEMGVRSAMPDFVFRRYQSAYVDYNWYFEPEPERTQYLTGSILAEKWGDARISLVREKHYAYFDTESMPAQYSGNLTYLKIFTHKDFRFAKFTWDTRLQYQQVAEGSEVLHLPRWLGETALYYTGYVFKGDPLFLQTGINVKYFSAYYAGEFNPLINAFYLQNERLTGGEPVIDLFVNGKVQTMRLYLKAENLSALWGRHLLSTPSRPYRDFTVRFGLVWNFFK